MGNILNFINCILFQKNQFYYCKNSALFCFETYLNMKTRTLGIFLANCIFIFTGCFQQTNPDTVPIKNTWKIKTQKFLKENYFTDVLLQYPTILVNDTLQHPVNDSIQKLVDNIRREFSGALLEQKKANVDEFLKNEKISKSENSQKYQTIVGTEIFETEDFFSILISVYSYSLGAHGSTYRKAWVLNKQTLKRIQLADFVDFSNSKNSNAFQQILLDHFDGDEYCEIPQVSGEYPMFFITNSHLGIAFNDYDFGAYTCGSTPILIDLKLLNDAGLLKLKPSYV